MIKDIPLFAKGKLSRTKESNYALMNCSLSFYVNDVEDGIATDVELEMEKTKLFNQDDETDYSFCAELPYQKDIDEMYVDTLDDVENKPNGMVIWELMAFEFCNDEISKQYEFDFVKTKDGYYLVCEESVGQGMYSILQSEIIGFTRYKLTDEDLKIITVDGEKVYEDD